MPRRFVWMQSSYLEIVSKAFFGEFTADFTYILAGLLGCRLIPSVQDEGVIFLRTEC